MPLLVNLRRALAGPITTMTGVGLTSRWVAANRALETEHAQPLYCDPLARDLAGADRRISREIVGRRWLRPGPEVPDDLAKDAVKNAFSFLMPLSEPRFQ